MKASVVLSVVCSRNMCWFNRSVHCLEPNTDYYFFVGTTDPAECGTFEFTTTGIFLGCTDPAADNYYDIANQDDGSCEYSVVPDNDLCENAFDLPCNAGYQEGSMGGATGTGSPVDLGNPAKQAKLLHTYTLVEAPSITKFLGASLMLQATFTTV